MVSQEHEAGYKPARPKRRAAACDFCRHKKARCSNGQDMSGGGKCANCLVYDVDCTYTEASKKSPPRGYVESLEKRLINLEAMVKQASPGLDLDAIMRSFTTLDKNNRHEDMNVPDDVQREESQNLPFLMVRPHFDSDDGGESTTEDEEETMTQIKRTKLVADGLETPMFTGKSSFLAFSWDAVQAKREMTGYKWTLEDPASTTKEWKRPDFWMLPNWMIQTFRPPEDLYVFPEEDLLNSLVDLYFTHVNLFYPLLHRPTFEKCRAEGLHLQDAGFGATVLLVCAIGCRFSDDIRISNTVTTSSSSTGWFLFNQVGRLGLSWYSPHSIYDLQVYPLAALFLEGVATPQSGWILVGTGLRFVLDVGAHRRRLYGTEPSAEGELWKRAFWVLLVLDRLTGSMLGRPCALQDADFDVELPIDCDDEYWDHPDPAQNFKQPPGKTSRLTFFVWFIKLNQILAFALRTIYSIKKSRVVLGYEGSQWEPRIVAELDSALNRWETTLPEFLRQKTREDDVLLLRQSVVLHARFYELRMVIHRSFVQARKKSVMSTISLSICLQAARSCCHMVYSELDRLDRVKYQCVHPMFVSCVLFIVKGWGGKLFGSTINSREFEDANKCLQFLLLCRDRWIMAGKFLDMVNAVIQYKGSPSVDKLKRHAFSFPVLHVLFESPTSSNKSSPLEDDNKSSSLPPQPHHDSHSQSGDSSDMDVAGAEDIYHLPLHLAQYFFAEMDQASFDNPTSNVGSYLYTQLTPDLSATNKQQEQEQQEQQPVSQEEMALMLDSFMTTDLDGSGGRQPWSVAEWSDALFSAPENYQTMQNPQQQQQLHTNDMDHHHHMSSQQAQMDPSRVPPPLAFDDPTLPFNYFQF